MFSDTLTITINSVAKILNRINQDGYSSEYYLRSATEDFRLKIRNTAFTDKRYAVDMHRHNLEFVHTVFPVSPATVPTVRKYYSVFESPATDSVVDVSKFVAGITGFQTEANVTKMINWES